MGYPAGCGKDRIVSDGTGIELWYPTSDQRMDGWMDGWREREMYGEIFFFPPQKVKALVR